MKNYSKFTFYVTGDKLYEGLTALYLRIQAQKESERKSKKQGFKTDT